MSKRPLSERLQAKQATSGSSKSPKAKPKARKSKPTKPPVQVPRSNKKDGVLEYLKPAVPKAAANKVEIPPLWKHQKQTKALAKKTPIVYDTSDPGTGKTRAHLEAFAERRRHGGKKALVIAPKPLLQTAWQDDAAEYTPDMSSVVAYAENREEAFAVNVDIYITNTDAVNWLAKQPASFFKEFDTIIVDESTTFKHRTSNRSKAIGKVKDHFTYRVLMTGTPYNKSVTELWHQIFLLDDGQRLGHIFYQFRNAVCTPEQVGPSARMVQWVDKEGAEEAVTGLLQDISIRHVFDECMDIPPNHTYSVDFHPSKRMMEVYRQMEDEAVVFFKEFGDSANAVNAAAMRSKLLQIASGAIYSDNGYAIVDRARYELISELVEAREHSIVFFLWKHQKEELVNEAVKRGITYEVIDGDTPNTRRAEIVRAYQAGAYQTLFLHPQTGAHGLTLTKGTASIWASPVYQPDFLKQGLHRIYRGGQTKPTETILVEAKGTVERVVYEILSGRRKKLSNFLDLIRASLEERQ